MLRSGNHPRPQLERQHDKYGDDRGEWRMNARIARPGPDKKWDGRQTAKDHFFRQNRADEERLYGKAQEG